MAGDESDQTLSRLGQQPGGETPGVAAAPVALAAGIIPGFARFIVTPWLHALEFGVGTTAGFGSMLVPPSSATAG
jgi:hypothetical protein